MSRRRGRWGRATAEHPRWQQDDTGRVLLSREAIARTACVHTEAVRRALVPVACHRPTRALLYDMAEAQAWLDRRAAKGAGGTVADS